ncbi:MAG TPA: DUF434 domain-containing protein [Pyrinomonadaceae bacterium]|jgi:hypothetical protein
MCPDNRQHRGSHPADRRLFESAQLPALRRATAELSWLLSREYALKSALKLVGDRYNLTERQRLAISRAACSDASLERRAECSLAVSNIGGQRLLVDGFNLIITIEAALGGGPLLVCRDDCIRDLSSVHGSYRSVEETEKAIRLIGASLAALNPLAVRWLLDRPISNSGRLAARIKELAHEQNWPWTIDVIFNPDAELASSAEIVVTSDSAVLDRAGRWINLNAYLIGRHISQAWLIDCRA